MASENFDACSFVGVDNKGRLKIKSGSRIFFFDNVLERELSDIGSEMARKSNLADLAISRGSELRNLAEKYFGGIIEIKFLLNHNGRMKIKTNDYGMLTYENALVSSLYDLGRRMALDKKAKMTPRYTYASSSPTNYNESSSLPKNENSKKEKVGGFCQIKKYL